MTQQFGPRDLGRGGQTRCAVQCSLPARSKHFPGVSIVARVEARLADGSGGSHGRRSKKTGVVCSRDASSPAPRLRATGCCPFPEA